MAVFYDDIADRLSIAVGDLLHSSLIQRPPENYIHGLSLIGQDVHQLYQEYQSEKNLNEFESEKRVKISLFLDSTEVVISGRIDNYWVENNSNVVEEIKTQFEPVEQPLPADELQTQLYMWIISKSDISKDNVKGFLSYVTPDLSITKQFNISLSPDFEELLLVKIKKILDTQKKENNRLQKRAKSLPDIKWPFDDYRENQQKIGSLVLENIEAKQNLLFESPTGSGKTAPVLHSSLIAALRQNYRIAFATSRTSQQKNKAEFLINNFPNESLGRILILSSVQKFKRDSLDPVHRFLDPYDLPEWFNEFLDSNCLFDLEVIQNTADALEIDAANLQHELISRVDILIGDQNLLANPDYRLHSWYVTARGARKTILLIDEIHGLSDRLRESRSFTLSLKSIKWASSYIQDHLDSSTDQTVSIISELESCFAIYFESEPEVELQRYQKLDETQDLDTLFYHLFINQTETASLGENSIQFLEFQDNILNACRYSQQPYLYSIFLDRQEQSISWILIETSELYSPLWKNTQATIGFSATLTPFEYSMGDLGMIPQKTTAISFASNELFAGLHTFRYGGIDTRYRQRHNTLIDLCSLLEDIQKGRDGDWLVFFPSREYLFIADQQLKLNGVNTISLVNASSGLANLMRKRNGDKSSIYLSLLGGIIAEGFDLPYLEFAGIAIVSLGIPPMSPKAELIRESSQLSDEEGQFVAYILPGIRKVQQAAGRLIRKPGQEGVLVLIDDRYSDPEIESILPNHWLLTSPFNEKSALIDAIISI